MPGVNPGPIDGHLLYQQNIHISNSIWENKTEHILGVHNHYIDDPIDPRVLNYVHKAGFYGLYQLGFCRVDNALITALVERWRPETYTFHFPPGECTITLQDIEILGGVCVDGQRIICSEQGDTKGARIGMIEMLLGRRPTTSDVDEGGASVRTSWLSTHFSELPHDADNVTIRCFARAAILLLLGSQFLSDKPENFVSLVYLPFLEDFDSCRGYSWGSAILACLYRNLCKAAVGEVDGFFGAAILLQFWAWSRLTQTRPRNLVPSEVVVQPGQIRHSYGQRWAMLAGRRAPDTVAPNLKHYRDHFDQMQPSQIVWEPYLPYMDEIITDGRIIWRARVPLLCLDIVEFHQPDRVLRQFGMMQPIPEAPMRNDRAHRMSEKGRARADWPTFHATNLGIWNDRINQIIVGVVHDGNTTVSNDYMAWYLRITRRLIWPPTIVPPARGFRANATRMEIMKDLLWHSYREFQRLQSFDNVQYLEQGFAQLQLDPAHAYKISGSGVTKNLTAAETKKEVEEKHVIYIRSVNEDKLSGHDWFRVTNDNDLSQKAPICKCGAVRDLIHPCFSRPKKYLPKSDVAAVGHFIYVFGGCDWDDKGECFESGEVSYIDTLNPGEGWKVCKEKMPTARIYDYPINIPVLDDEEEEERVLLVGGFDVREAPFAQMYYPSKDKWVVSESFPDQRPCYDTVWGHAVVREGEEGDTVVLMHDYRSRNLFTYNVNKDSWGTRWKNTFGEKYHTGALVCGILYVLDVATLFDPARVVLCGYDVSSEEESKCLPVEILMGKGKKWRGKECVPLSDGSECDSLPFAKLLPMGDNKLAMVWDLPCFHDKYKPVCPRRSVYWSIFEMIKRQCEGGLKLVARPLSHVCHHVYNNGNFFDTLVPVYPYRNDEKVKQNKTATMEDSNKDKEVHQSPPAHATK